MTKIQETRYKKQETRNKKQETRNKKQDTRYKQNDKDTRNKIQTIPGSQNSNVKTQTRFKSQNCKI